MAKAAKAKQAVIRSERLEELLRSVADVSRSAPSKEYPAEYLAAYRLSERADSACSYVDQESEAESAAKKLAKKRFPDEPCCHYVPGPRGVVVFPGAEDDVVSAVGQAAAEFRAEARLSPLLRDEIKADVHKFLAQRSIYSVKGGRYKSREKVRQYAAGYMAAWEKFGGKEAHPRPYVLAPNYGVGSGAAAYLLSAPPEQILEEAENEFSVHLVMKA